MVPTLRACSDGADHRISELIERLSDEFKLSDEDRAARLPSGAQPLMFNRTHWAVTYLAKASLLDRTGRGVVRISATGREVLAQAPERIDIKFLRRFPAFQEWQARAALPESSPADAEAIEIQDPEELLASTYDRLRRTVEADLLEHVMAATPEFFERLVLQLLEAMGYGVAEHVGRTGDDGIDGIVHADKLGLDSIYVQAKRWRPDHAVSGRDIRDFAGSLDLQHASRGVFITTSRFTAEARSTADRTSRLVRLIDGPTLTGLLYDFGIGLRERDTFRVRRVDSAYFEGEI
jgi:restriction system protein